MFGWWEQLPLKPFMSFRLCKGYSVYTDKVSSCPSQCIPKCLLIQNESPDRLILVFICNASIMFQSCFNASIMYFLLHQLSENHPLCLFVRFHFDDYQYDEQCIECQKNASPSLFARRDILLILRETLLE